MQSWLKSRPNDEQRSLASLFDASFASLVQFVEQRLTSTAAVYSELYCVSQTCSLLDGLLSRQSDDDDDRRTTAGECGRYERLYVFAFLWSFGVLLPTHERAKLDEFVRNHDKMTLLDLPPNVAGATLFDYLVDSHGV